MRASLHQHGVWLAQRRATAAVEFAMVGSALFFFLLAIVNLGILGLTLGALVHGVQSAARAAAVQTANTYATTGTITCPSNAAIIGDFNNAADPPLPAASGSTGNPAVTTAWTDNGNATVTTKPPGVYLTMTATYRWVPVGFAAFGAGITLNITTVATVTGTSQAAAAC
jgi:Flp pilus assembly protein TadG